MPLYPLSIRRCQYIKVNGTQCGSPALRNEKYCHFHMQFHQRSMQINLSAPAKPGNATLPTLEDANSVQMGLAEVMRLLLTRQVDPRTAALLLNALRTAATNLKRTCFEPPQPTDVVIDPDSVKRRPIGANAWSAVEGREYDQLTPDHSQQEYTTDEGRRFMADLTRLSKGVARDPGYLDRPMVDRNMVDKSMVDGAVIDRAVAAHSSERPTADSR